MKGESDSYRVVVVEDEGLIAEDLRRRLTSAGFQVEGIADSSINAMRVIRATSPDVVLMDIRIKGNEDGIQVAQRVREELDIPVIYVTGYEDRTTLERASETVPYGYIKKPIAGASLRGSIEIAIAKHRHDRYLHEQRNWALANLSAVPSALVVTDRFGRVSWLNPLAGEMIGSDTENTLGRSWGSVLPFSWRDSGEPLEDLVSTAISLGETVALPPDIVLACGRDRARSVEGTISPAWQNNRVDGAVISFQDVTVARLEEMEARLGSTWEAVRRVVAEIVQSLPNSETVEAAWDAMQMLVDRLPEPGPLHERLGNIQQTVMDSYALSARLAALLELPEVHCERVTLNELLASLDATIQRIAPGLTVSIEDALNPVHADVKQLATAILAIVLYARLHARSGGELALDVSHPEMRQMCNWTRIQLTYPRTDKGSSDLGLAFEPDFSDPSQDLHAAYGAIRRMGGLLIAQPGRNNTNVFAIYLRQVQAAIAGQTFPAIEEGVELGGDHLLRH